MHATDGGTDAVGGTASLGEAWVRAVRTAYLLTADHGTAEELAVAALVRQRRRRLRPATADIRRLVLTPPWSHAWRLRSRPPGRSDPGDPVLLAYLALPVRSRALLVLRVGHGLDGPAAAAVLGLPADRARATTVDALDALRGALREGGSEGGGRAAAELDLGEIAAATAEDDGESRDPLHGDPVVPRLEALFAELSATVPVVADPARRVEAALARARRHRRRNVLVVAILAVVATGSGVVVAQRNEAALAEQLRAERRRAVDAVLHPVVQGSDVTTWPTRGSLAGRADLIAQVRAVVAGGGSPVLSVPFLGEIGGLHVALAVDAGGDGENARRLVTVTRPASRPVGRWELLEDTHELDDGAGSRLPVLSAAVTDPDGVTRLVVATVSTGVALAYSRRPLIDGQGSPMRRYTPLALVDGVGTATWQGPASATAVRAWRGEEPPVLGPIMLTNGQPLSMPRSVERRVAGSCRARAFDNLRRNVDDVGVGVADGAGYAPSEIVRVRAVGCRRVTGQALMFLAVRLRDGNALQSVLEDIRYEDGGLTAVGVARPVPSGRGESYPRYASFSVLTEDPAPALARAALFCAPGGATAELVRTSTSGQGDVVVKARLGEDGVGVGRAAAPLDDLVGTDPDGVFVVVRDAAGREVERVPASVGDDVRSSEIDGPVDPPGSS